MRITVVGKGNVGGGLARRWEIAGHDVTALGRAGGDAAGADVVLVAIPSAVIADGLARVSGLGGQVTIDATNIFGPYPAGYDALAQQVKSIIRDLQPRRSIRTSPPCMTGSTPNRVRQHYSHPIPRLVKLPSN